MNREQMKGIQLEGIRTLLSQLHTEVQTFKLVYRQMLSVVSRLETDAWTDDLTGLLRRKPFFEKWQALLKECESLNQSCGMLLIDLDHFKRINDTCGHPTGDEVLKRVAECLKQYESPDCIVGRYGGEEFAVAIRGTDAEILGIAEKIRREASTLQGSVRDSDGKPQQWKCTLSVGMASSRSEGYDAARLLKSSDEALYEAKNKGRNQVKAA